MTHPDNIAHASMMDAIKNPDAFVLFFHGLDSSNETTKFTCIERTLKYCQSVDYRRDFQQIFTTYETMIRHFQTEHTHLVLAGHSLGGWFANHFAHKFELPALLISPAIDIRYRLVDRIPVLADMTTSFPTHNPKPMIVMIEEDDERLPVEVARRTLVNLPASWRVEYFAGGHHRICRQVDINDNLSELCEDDFLIIDFDYVDKAAYLAHKAKFG